MLTWMLCTVVFSGLVSLAAHLVESALRGGAARRHVWTGAVLVSLIAPALALAAGGAWPPGVLLPDVVELAADAAGLHGPAETTPASAAPSSTVPADPAALTIPADGPASPGTATAFRATSFAAGGWVLLTCLLVVLYGAVWLRFLGAAGEWRRARLHDQDVRVAARLGPAVFGLRRATIVVPEWLLAAPAGVQRVVLLHEVEHARAGDHVLLGLAPLALMLMPWNVPLWWQLHRMRLAIEMDCDARVLRRGVPVRDYGALLIDIAGRSTLMPRPLAALSEPRTSLERRILAMSTISARPSTLRTATTLVAAALLAVTAFDAFGFMAAPLPPSTSTLASAEHAQPSATTGAPAIEARNDAAIDGMIDGRRFGDFLNAPADTPLVVIDRVIVAAEDVQATIGDAQILGVEVVTDAAKLADYGERARDGAIFITTSRSAPGYAVDVVTAGEIERPLGVPVSGRIEMAGPERMVIRGSASLGTDNRPLMVVDGVVIGRSGAANPDMTQVESITVLRGARAIELYGEGAADGAILIRTKTAADRDRQ